MAYTNPGAYKSQNQNVINQIMDKINKRDTFKYDFNADPIYQQYKDQYTALGTQAAANATANAANMSGGYANSYATTAAAQANQQYLSQLNNVIPQLYQAAQNQYNQETENLYNQYSMLGDAEDRDYKKWQDANSNYQWQQEYNAARDEFNKQYQLSQDQFAYTKQRDQVSDSQWQKTYDAARDEFAKQYQLSLDEYNTSKEQWQQEFDYNKSRDQVADSQWQSEFNESVRQYNQNYALSAATQSASSGTSSSGGSRSSSGSSGSSKSSTSKSSTAKSSSSKSTTSGIPYKNPATATTTSLSSYFTGAKFAYNNNSTKGLTTYLNNLVNSGKITSAQANSIRNQVKAGYTSYKAL